jgi:hypothetical protein
MRRRILLIAAAVVLPVTGLTLGIAGTASAGTGKIVCTTVAGNASSTVTVSGCTGGNTGGSSQPISATTLASGGTIDWVSGSTTTISAPVLTSVSAKKCPGYVKGGSSNPAAESFTANVTGDTGDGMLLPATATGEVCVASDGTISALKPLEAAWTKSSITCTTLTGNVSSTTTASGCTGGNTGGGSEPVNSADLATGGTITWLSGGSTTIGEPTETATSAKHCPGYVKGASSEPSAFNIVAPVTADTGDGLTLAPKGTVKGAVCVASDGSITALKPLTLK